MLSNRTISILAIQFTKGDITYSELRSYLRDRCSDMDHAQAAMSAISQRTALIAN